MNDDKSNVISKLESSQALYGTRYVSTTVMTNPQLLYAAPAPPIQSLYGIKQPQPFVGDINITYSQIEENIATLESAIKKLKDSWETETKKNLAKLNNSWIGKDCIAYTSKLTSMDKKVKNTISALELLCSTYKRARDMIQDKQIDVTNLINNIN